MCVLIVSSSTHSLEEVRIKREKWILRSAKNGNHGPKNSELSTFSMYMAINERDLTPDYQAREEVREYILRGSIKVLLCITYYNRCSGN